MPPNDQQLDPEWPPGTVRIEGKRPTYYHSESPVSDRLSSSQTFPNRIKPQKSSSSRNQAATQMTPWCVPKAQCTRFQGLTVTDNAIELATMEEILEFWLGVLLCYDGSCTVSMTSMFWYHPWKA